MNNFLVYFYPLNRLKPIRVIEPLISCQNRRSLFGSFAFKKTMAHFACGVCAAGVASPEFA